MQWFRDLFSESSTVSMTRFLSFVCVLTASAIALYAVHVNAPLDPVSILCGVFLSAGITGKVVQKSMELKASKGPSNELKE